MRISDHVATARGPVGYHIHQASSGLTAHTLGGGPRYFRPLVPAGWQWDACCENERWYWGATDLQRSVGHQRLTLFDGCVDAAGPTPYRLVYDYAARGETMGRPDWRRMLDVVGGDGPMLPRPSTVLLMQGWLYTAEQMTGTIDVARNTLLVLGVSAISSLANLLGSPDVTTLLPTDGSAVLCFHRPGDEALVEAEGWRTAKATAQPHLARTTAGFTGYDCRLVERVEGEPLVVPTAAEHADALTWDRVVRRLTVQEQAELLRRTLPADLMDVAVPRGNCVTSPYPA